MNQVKSISDLRNIKSRYKKQLSDEIKSDASGIIQIKISMATCGIASGAKEILDYFEVHIELLHILL